MSHPASHPASHSVAPETLATTTLATTALATAMDRAEAMNAASVYISGSVAHPAIGYRRGTRVSYEAIAPDLAAALLDRFAVAEGTLCKGLLLRQGRSYRWYCVPVVDGEEGYAPLIAVHRPALHTTPSMNDTRPMNDTRRVEI